MDIKRTQDIKEKAKHSLDTEKEYEREKELMEIIKNRFVIDIGYMNISDERMARVTKTGKFFSILLAKSFQIFKERSLGTILKFTNTSKLV